eukprot:s4171_g4.t1
MNPAQKPGQHFHDLHKSRAYILQSYNSFRNRITLKEMAMKFPGHLKATKIHSVMEGRHLTAHGASSRKVASLGFGSLIRATKATGWLLSS